MGERPSLSMVIGGAASGKSDFAERLVISAKRPRTYIATAQAFDDEMAAKISRHKEARAKDGWVTIEEPHQVAATLGGLDPSGIALIDCATLWLSNMIMKDADLAAETDALINALLTAPCPIVVVTNETGQGIVPDNPMARSFRQHQGQLNRRVAAQSDLVVQVVVGLPQVLKGQLPEGLA